MAALNGDHVEGTATAVSTAAVVPVPTKPPRMNDLPDEIIHITEGYIPMSLMISRLVQHTHNSIQDKILQLARMPLPPTLTPAPNGNTTLPPKDKDEWDNSSESLSKKVNLLKLVQNLHGKWVKMLIIANWSRRSEMISKLIDLKTHLNQQLLEYDMRLDQIISLKRDLTYARLPSPDIKTALHVLSSGDGSWLPDLMYLDPPPISDEEHAKWLEDLDTLLSVRLNIDDFDKIPHHFRDYSIASGRVTFKVAGEFEVDLTIADEDFSRQFWFIDFRFTFSPATAALSEMLEQYLESSVNERLARDGLAGCYHLLHEFTLTHKISELRRQAIELSQASWTRTITIERLDRALSIQYWASRFPPIAPKSWIIIAVNSGKGKDSHPDPKQSSHLSVAWYRDGKEAKGVDIAWDTTNLCTEKLLKTVIARHTEHILRSIYQNLSKAPRFAKREAAMKLSISLDDPVESSLTMQLTSTASITLQIEPVTGRFIFRPYMKASFQAERRLNFAGKDPSEDGAACLENIRWQYLAEEAVRKGTSTGWNVVKNPLSAEEVKSLARIRESCHPVCFQRNDLDRQWYVMLVMSLSGDNWLVFQVGATRPVTAYSHFRPDTSTADLAAPFWNNLTIFVAGIISHTAEVRELGENKLRLQRRVTSNIALPRQVVIPSIFIKLSDLLPHAVPADETAPSSQTPEPASKNTGNGPPRSLRKPWAFDYVELKYRGVQLSPRPCGGAEEGSQPKTDDKTSLFSTTDAFVRVLDRKKFALLLSRVDKDVSYNARRGEFCIRLRDCVGHSSYPSLKTRLRAIDRLVDFLDAMGRATASVTCESVTLQKVVFTYGDKSASETNAAAPAPAVGSGNSSLATAKRFRVSLNLAQPRIRVELEDGNPHLRVIDLLTTLVNQPGGITNLTLALPTTLNIMSVVNKLEMQWRDVAVSGRASLTVTHKALDRITLCYSLPDASRGRPRTANLEIRARHREGQMWWHVRRTDANAPPDVFGQRLKKMWDARNAPWRGLNTGAAVPMDADGRVPAMLNALDRVMRDAMQASGKEHGNS